MGLAAQLCPPLCDTLGCSLPHLCPWDSPGQNTGVGYHDLLQGIFPTQVSHIAGRFFNIWTTMN